MSKVVFKMTFKHPNKPDTSSKNVSHVGYISTRSGVDKTLTESDLKKELEKGIEDLSSDDESYVKYINERPRSHGLFGKDGIEDPQQVQDEVSKVESFVWRGIVSLKEEDAKQLGYTNKENWQNMLRANVPEMAEKMGIRVSNLRWAAAVHMEKGHPHAHIIFWEKQPEKTVGVVKPKILDDIRKMYTDDIFEEQRLQLMNEKNLMRDLLRDLAKDDISKATKLIKEVQEEGQDIKTFLGITDQEGVMPRLYSKEEEVIAEKIKELGEMLPGKGRVALKFMPENVKEEVRSIADYLLKQPEFSASLEKNLKAVEELTKMYTGKEDDINKARDNAYNDIRDRLCQIILKGAAESQRKNIFYVDKELSEKAVDFIKNLNNQINVVPEQTKVLNEISIVLVKTGHTDEQIIKHLTDFSERENIQYSKEAMETIIKQIRESGSDKAVNSLSSEKIVNYYLSVLKLSGYEENEAFNLIRETIKNDSKNLNDRLQQLKDDGVLKEVNGEYKLTNKGIQEFLKVKDLDKVEKEIFKMLEADGDIIPKVNFKELLENKDVFDNLYNRDPQEFKLGKYDAKVRDEFGEKNSLTFKELEERIYEKYTDEEFNTNTDKADVEIELLEKRIEKLTLNGYVKYDRESGVYSFTDEVDSYFEYDEEKENFFYTEAAMDELGINDMEFTRYDAKVTLSYIDKAENNILTEQDLREMLHKEIVNQTAKRYYESFTSILDSKQAEDYVGVSENGELSSTIKGQELGKQLNSLNKYFYECKGKLTEEKLKNICIREFGDQGAEKKFIAIMDNVNKLMANGHIHGDIHTGVYKINPLSSDINRLLYQIYKEGGTINRDNLKDVLEKNITNREAENQLKYLIKRLDNLKSEGYLHGNEKEYLLNEKGIEKREDLLTPQRDILRGKIDYLQRLGFLENTDEGYKATAEYYKYMKNIALSKEEKKPRESEIISRDISSIIDRTQDKVDVGKIERSNERIATGKYINGEYDNIKADYENMRSYCNVQDTVAKQINNIATTLMVSGVNLDETKEILQQWNVETNSNIDTEKINSIIEKAHEVVKENNTWGQTTVISSKEWKEMFSSLGVEEKDIPKWMYKGENWLSFNKGIGIASIVNDLWKTVWKQLERDRMQTQMQAEQMKRQMNKQLAASQSKAAMVEQARKSKDRGNMYRDDELER
jgi:hypothetical protein